MKLRIRKKKIVENNKPLNEDLANDSSLLNDFVDLFYTVDTAKVKEELNKIKTIGESLVDGKIIITTKLQNKGGDTLSSTIYSNGIIKGIGNIGEILLNDVFKNKGLTNKLGLYNIKNSKFPDYISENGLYIDFKFLHNGKGNATLGSLIDSTNDKQDFSIKQELKNFINNKMDKISHLKSLLFVVSYKEIENSEYVEIKKVEIIPLLFAFGYKNGIFSIKSNKNQQLSMRTGFRRKKYTQKKEENGVKKYIEEIIKTL